MILQGVNLLRYVASMRRILLDINFVQELIIAEYEELKSEIRFDLKSVRRSNEPFVRVDSVHCLLWFELGKTCSYERRLDDSVTL